MASPASKQMAKIWQCRRSLCQPGVSCLAITIHTGPGAPEGRSPVKNNPRSCKDSSVQCKVANKS